MHRFPELDAADDNDLGRSGFTLVELLVVVSIIALLIAILLPSLKRAREQSKLVVCKSNLHQIGTGIQLYAQDNLGLIPRGPDPVIPIDLGGNHLATNQLWLGNNASFVSMFSQCQFTGLGMLHSTTLPDLNLFFCPSDNSFNRTEESPKIPTSRPNEIDCATNTAYTDDGFGSYQYRQLDQLPNNASTGNLDRLGFHVIDGIKVNVTALALDTNALGLDEDSHHTNHKGEFCNVLFRDASVSTFRNRDNVLGLSREVFEQAAIGNLQAIFDAMDQLLINADFAYGSSPHDAPSIQTAR
ncbi:MAG TPA: prepilin-type N-terminal cleavage/methylation domain-containing protein [Phycisphaerae bacterium]|nr:prepilin-type N-terminal cleavage/methylation domain-containing protein [Phycisphaerae bacterium]